MSRRSRWILILLIATPLLAAAGTVALLTGDGDQPVSPRDPAPDGPPPTDVMGTVVGTVTTADGEPVAGALVEPRSLDDPSPPIPEIPVYTDAEGRYSWRLHPGDYEFVAHADDRSTALEVASVTAGETTTLDITFP